MFYLIFVENRKEKERIEDYRVKNVPFPQNCFPVMTVDRWYENSILIFWGMIQLETGRGLKIFCSDIEVTLRNSKKNFFFANSSVEKLRNAGVQASWGLYWTRTLTAAYDKSSVQHWAFRQSAWMMCSGASSIEVTVQSYRSRCRRLFMCLLPRWLGVWTAFSSGWRIVKSAREQTRCDSWSKTFLKNFQSVCSLFFD